METNSKSAEKSSAIASANNSSSTAGPLWAEGTGGKNMAALWLSHLSQSAPLSASQQALPSLLPALLFQNLALDSSRSRAGHLFFTLTVAPSITNAYPTLHGGVIAALVEILGSAAIKSVAENLYGYVTDINLSYIRGTPPKEEMEIESKVVQIGEEIVVATVEIRNKKSAKIAAQGRITVYRNQASKL